MPPYQVATRRQAVLVLLKALFLLQQRPFSLFLRSCWRGPRDGLRERTAGAFPHHQTATAVPGVEWEQVAKHTLLDLVLDLIRQSTLRFDELAEGLCIARRRREGVALRVHVIAMPMFDLAVASAGRRRSAFFQAVRGLIVRVCNGRRQVVLVANRCLLQSLGFVVRFLRQPFGSARFLERVGLFFGRALQHAG